MAELEEELYSFPVLVERRDGDLDISQKLENRLLCYFLSSKKSGGGDCKLCVEEGDGKKKQIVIYFAEESARQRVLSVKNHEIDMPNNKRIKLSVSSVNVENGPPLQDEEPQESSGTVVVVPEGEEITDDFVEMYFENKRRSGGGPIKSCVKVGKQFIITFEQNTDAQEVLQREDHAVKNMVFHVKQYQQRVPQDEPEVSTFLVLVENVQETVDEWMLNLLIENISDVSDQGFSVEVLPDISAAVISFFQALDIKEFIETFNSYHRTKQLNISARSLEVTHCILVENVPPDVCQNFITLYFESKKHGGGPVLETKCIAEENTAIITFQDSKDAAAVLKQKHFLNNVPVHVYPYYVSLGTALYGKERPQIKLPDPKKVTLDPYLWRFLEQNQPMLQEINLAMASCHCEIEWPSGQCAHPEILLHPSCTLSKQKRSLVKTWNEEVSTQFTQILSKQKVVKYHMSAEVWEAVRNGVVKEDILVIADIPKETVVLVGPFEAVAHTELEMNILVRKAVEKIEREKQTVEETFSVAARKYTILNNAGLQDMIHKEYPDLKMEYDVSEEVVTLRGVAAEVYKIKSIIREQESSLIQECIQIHPYIFNFLQFADNEYFSQLLFWAKKINAFYELQEETILLMAETPQDIQRAAEELNKELTYKCIELADPSVIRKREWSELTNTLCKMHNCSNENVVIQELEDQVVIAGCSREVASTHTKLSDFIDSNTYLEQDIRTKNTAVTLYVQKEKRKNWHDLELQGVKISFGTLTNRRCISLQGPRVQVLKAVDVFRKILSSLYTKKMVLDKPGAKAFFKERELLYVTGVKEQFNCLIRIEESAEEEDILDRNRNEEQTEEPRSKVHLKDSIEVTVHKGNLARFPVDVVVNAANDELKHIGGLASSLSDAAGPQLQMECSTIVKEQGRVQPGCAVITNPGRLPCKQVIHVVGPRWRLGEEEECVFLLKKAVKESLRLAEHHKHRSIAIPAVSSGVFGFPVKECAASIVRAIKETVEESCVGKNLKQICLVDFKEDTVQELSAALNEVFGNVSLPPKLPSASSSKSHAAKNERIPDGMTTDQGLRIVLEKKGIQDSRTDVIVTSVGRDLNLSSGPLSKALLDKAGAEIQEELLEQGKRKQTEEGDVLKTRGYALPCSYVLHAIVPAWKQDQQNEILGDIVKKCLKMSEDLLQKSITIPAMGTGILRFPKPFVAKLMFDEVIRFSQQENPKFIQEVHFALFPGDPEAIKAFGDELKTRLNLDQTRLSDIVSDTMTENDQQKEQAVFEPISPLLSGGHKMQLGPILLQVESGDITQETTDAIVNITNSTFNLRSGVSKAILKGAGKEVEKECADLAAQVHNNLICTQAGNLGCKNVIHLVANDDVKAQVQKVLKECERRQFTSVAFPAIGTGKAGRDPVVMADDMIDAISDFAKKTPTAVVKMIKIIIFQSHLLSVYQKSMQRKDLTAVKHDAKAEEKSFFSKVLGYLPFKKSAKEVKTPVVLERPVEPTVFQICGESQKKVDDAEAWVKNLILTEQYEISLSDESILNLEGSDYEILKNLQSRLHIVIKSEQVNASPSLRISGITKDVMKANEEIQKMIKRARERQEEQSKAEILGNLVEWQYEDNGQYRAFDRQVNMQLEYAAQKQKLHEITIENKCYKVDPSKLCAVDDIGTRITLRRISKAEAIPEEWEKMEQTRVKLVSILPGTMEYQDVATAFNQTCNSYRIEKIERIQNPSMWQAYQIKKHDMDVKNSNKNNERRLFHGTAGTSLTHINNSGFNRSYAGLHAAVYGNGTYFAVNANYSAQNTYSAPDADGTKYMYFARVLVGNYCVGSKGLIVPPPKSQVDPTDLFDSVTDNTSKPSLFVIFNDIQAYPEYLITFRK